MLSDDAIPILLREETDYLLVLHLIDDKLQVPTHEIDNEKFPFLGHQLIEVIDEVTLQIFDDDYLKCDDTEYWFALNQYYNERNDIHGKYLYQQAHDMITQPEDLNHAPKPLEDDNFDDWKNYQRAKTHAMMGAIETNDGAGVGCYEHIWRYEAIHHMTKPVERLKQVFNPKPERQMNWPINDPPEIKVKYDHTGKEPNDVSKKYNHTGKEPNDRIIFYMIMIFLLTPLVNGLYSAICV